MSPSTRDQERLRQRRRRADRRFGIYARIAVLLAMGFLGFFVFDIVRTGFSAFWQAELQVAITYNEETVEIPPLAVEEPYPDLVSHGRVRTIPLEVEQQPELMGTSHIEWVLATSDVDQYLKDKPNGLSEEEKQLVDQLAEQGRTRLPLNRGFFTQGDSNLPEMAGIWSAVTGSFFVLALVFLFSFPIGVMTAIYLEEFAPDNWLTQTIEVNINNLAAIPSIIFGLLGLAFFINLVGVPRSSALAGALTLSLMTLPIIIISARAALRAVPSSIRLAAMSVGATRWQAVRDHVVPQAISGILTGSIIGLAQAMGETAPLIIVGMIAFIPEAPQGVTDPTTVLPAQIYTWSTASLRGFQEKTAAGILVLLIVLLTMNAIAVTLRARLERRW